MWGDAECKNASFRRFSCYCKPCYADLVHGGDFQKCETRAKVGVYKAGAYCNDPIKEPILPKKPTAPEATWRAVANVQRRRQLIDDRRALSFLTRVEELRDAARTLE